MTEHGKTVGMSEHMDIRELIQIRTWEIELLDDESDILGLSLHDAMMALKHATNQKFTLFHSSINISGRNATFLQC